MDLRQFMDFAEPIVLVIGALALLWAFVALVIIIVKDTHFLRAYKKRLHQRFNQLRIHKMLSLLGVSERRYFHRSLDAQVETQLDRCAQCPNLEACDAALAKGDVSNGKEFCPNFDELLEFSRHAEKSQSTKPKSP